MMRNILFFLLFTNSALAVDWLSDRSFEVPQGAWVFKGNYRLNKLRIAEEVPAPDKKPSDRVKELRGQGFQCIHKNPQLYLCTKIVTGAKLSPEQEDFVVQGFKGFKMQFVATQNKPDVTFDGSDQTDYFMLQDVQILSFRYSRYGVSVMDSGETYFKFISAEENEPTLIFSRIQGAFGLPVILQSTVNGQIWGYYLDVLVESL